MAFSVLLVSNDYVVLLFCRLSLGYHGKCFFCPIGFS